MAKAKKVETKKGYKYHRKQLTNPDGTRTSIYGKTQAELAEKVKAHRQKVGAIQPKSTMTVADYAASQLEIMRARVSDATYVGYEEKVRLHILPSLGEMRLCDVSPDDLERTLSRCMVLSTSAYRVVHMLLRRIFGAAQINGLIDRDPSAGLSSKGGIAPKEKHALSDEEAETLFAALDGLPVLTFVMVAYYCGLRREEILALKWENVILDSDTPYIRVRLAWRIKRNQAIISDQLKSRAALRDVPMPDDLAEHMRGVRKQAVYCGDTDYVFCGADGKPLSGTQYRNLWAQVTRRTTATRTYTRYANGQKTVHTVSPQYKAAAKNNSGVQYVLDFCVTPHQLRHTFVTNLIYDGVDLGGRRIIKKHETIKITMEIYAKVKYHRPEDLHAPVNNAFRRHRKVPK